MSSVRFGLVAAAVLAVSHVALGAQRSGEDVLTSAEDAFGTTVGGESIGLYNALSARGFSPVQAGNLRINGLYFDTRSLGGSRVRMSNRLTGASNVHVGLSAQSYPFPSPTGVVDYILRVPGDEFAVSTLLRGGYPDSATLEVDGQIPLTDTFRLGVGVSADHYTDNARMATTLDGALIGRWSIGDVAEVIPFYSRVREFEKKNRSFLFLGTDAFPVKYDRSVNLMQDWAFNNNDDIAYGSIIRASWTDWRLGVGVFRSAAAKPDGDSAQLQHRNIQPNGDAEVWIVRTAGDEKPNASYSGEARLSRVFLEAERRHTLHFNLRGKSTQNAYGGNVSRRVGTAKYYEPLVLPAPDWAPGPRGREFVRQGTAGVSYETIWKGVGEFSAGLQRTHYTRYTKFVNPTPSETTTAWLYNSTVAAYLSEKLVLYASYTKGLEDAPRAPPFSVSAGASASATITEQIDGGFRYLVLPGVNLVGGVFEVKKPFFELDTTGVFGQLGNVRHRGIEASVSGNLAPGLTVVAGLVRLQARLSGPLVDNGTMGEVPPEAAPLTGIFNIQFGPAAWKGFSVDARLNYTAANWANIENTFKTKAVTTVNAGARYRFRMGEHPASLRLQVQNLFDVWAWDVQGTQRQIQPSERRKTTLQLTVDY